RSKNKLSASIRPFWSNALRVGNFRAHFTPNERLELVDSAFQLCSGLTMISDIGSDSRSSSETIEEAFHRYQKSLEKVESLRDSVIMDLRRLERCERTINGKLQCIHLPEGLSNLNHICDEAENMFDEVRTIAKTLADNVKLGDIPERCQCRTTTRPHFTVHFRPIRDSGFCPPPKFHKMYDSILQSLIFDKCLIAFCKERKLLTFEVAASSLGVSTDHTVSFRLTLQDYLLGLLLLPAELPSSTFYARLAVNCVSNGNLELPLEIWNFIVCLDSCFRKLNFKNDKLRRRFDVMKYDVKTVEDVIYNINLRKLPSLPPSE
ncbi:hypothetical protein M513_02526, partial [Trichuris suis]